MSRTLKTVLIFSAVIVGTLKFRNQLLGFASKIPVVGDFVA